MTQLIDWHRDDGVNIDMISDHARNQFYHSILAHTHGRRCVDVGFGTGLLTLLALAHGAVGVDAYESDPERFRFGQHMIAHLGIGHLVQLHHQVYQAKPDDERLVFHEVLGNNLWDESAWSFVAHTRNIMPAVYRCEVWMTPISRCEAAVLEDTGLARYQQQRFHTWYLNIRDPSWPDCSSPDQFDQLPAHVQQECAELFGWDTSRAQLGYTFDPGVDIDVRYQQLIQAQVNTADHVARVGGISPIIWPSGPGPLYHQLVSRGQCVCDWTLDAATQQFHVRPAQASQQRAWPGDEIDIVLDPAQYQHQQMAVMLRHAVEHCGQRLYLTDSCWAPPANGAAIFDHVTNAVTLRQNLNTGQIRYFVATGT